MGTSKQNEDTPKLSYNILQLSLSKPQKNKRNLRRGDWGREGLVMGTTQTLRLAMSRSLRHEHLEPLCAPCPLGMKSNL